MVSINNFNSLPVRHVFIFRQSGCMHFKYRDNYWFSGELGHMQVPNEIIYNFVGNWRPPMWSSGQSSWLQIRRPEFDSRHYQNKKKVVVWNGVHSASWVQLRSYCLENREYGRREPSRWPRGTLYPQKLAITSPRSGGRSVGIVRSRTQTMEFFFYWQLTDAWGISQTNVLFQKLALGSIDHFTNTLTIYDSMKTKQRKTSFVVLVSKRTIPTERPPFVDIVSANFWG
jgi:hypothetical protein